MSRRLWIVLGLVGLLLVILLGDAFAFGSLPLPSSVARTTWTLHNYTSGGATVALPTGASVTITFHRVGHDFIGSDTCNSYSGSFSSSWPGHITLNSLAVTVVGCPDNIGAFETTYLNDLPKVESYRTTSSGLILSGDGGKLKLNFTVGSAYVFLSFRACPMIGCSCVSHGSDGARTST